MSDAVPRPSLRVAPFALAALVAAASFVAVDLLRLPLAELRGDEGTYVAMAASLARDRDLAFGAADAAWARARPGGAAVILQRTEDGIHYSKPVLYPLAAAPFAWLAEDAGLIAFNILVVGAALALARAFLARLGERAAATATVLTFAGASVVVPYLGWRMGESLQLALATAGLALALAGDLPAGASPRGWAERWLASPGAPWLGGALLGLLVSMREPHAAVAAVPVAVALASGARRRAAKVALAAVVAYALVLALGTALAGAPNAYKARRATFNAETGYPVSESSAPARRFERDENLATSSLSLEPDLQPALTAYSSLYFLVGRHSGLAVYFPAALALLATTLRRPGRRGWIALAGFAAVAAFYLVWWPSNYFGGETFVGNRYLLSAFPCLLFALPRLPTRRALALAWALAAVVGASALWSVARAGELDRTSQSHAYAGVFRLLPYESTATEIDGRRDRYWSGDFLRFVDPWARADRFSFALEAGRPAAEIELATGWEGDPTTWLVAADAPGVTLVVSDWRRTRRYALETHGEGSGGPVVVDLAPAWRRHPFWWSGDAPLRARLARFTLDPDPAHPDARATVRYVGRRELPTTFEAEAEIDALPESAEADRPLSRRLRLMNRGDWTWRTDDVLPVQVGVRYLPLGGRTKPAESRTPLPRAVAAGESVELDVTLDFPSRAAGASGWRVLIDLVVEDVAWFGDRGSGPIADGEVRILQRVESSTPTR